MADDANDNDTPIIRPLLDALQAQLPAAKRNTLRDLLARGQVRVNGKIVKIARMPISPEDRVEIVRGGASTIAAPSPTLGIPIVYEDDHLIVVDKPAGLLTSTVPSEKRPTALAMLRTYMAAIRPRARVGLIHRLDRDASGLLVFALSHPALASLKKQFAERTAGRVYAAVISSSLKPKEATIRSWLVEYADGTVHATKDRSLGDEAITHYKTVGERGSRDDYRALLRVSLETGRKHQIRAHLAEAGVPIVGDRVYGGIDAPRLMLAAIELKLQHPKDGRMRQFEIDLAEPIASQLR